MIRNSRLLVAGLLLVGSAADVRAQGTQLLVDASSSHIYVVTHRSGLFSFLGHEHAILAPAWDAELCWDEATIANSYARFRVAARELVIDTEEARAVAGMGSGPSGGQREQIQKKLLDANRLAVDQYPELRFETVSVSQASPEALNLRGRLTIKGVTRDVEVPAKLEQRETGRRLSAKFTIRQTHFNIKPESIAGVVKVSDPVDVHIVITARPTDRACDAL